MTYKEANIVFKTIETHGQLPKLAKEKAIEALKKQMPKKVIEEKNIYLWSHRS